MRVAGYVRVSTTKQAEEGLSLAEQERRVRAWAAAQGAEIEVFADRGVSGRRDDRPALLRLVSELSRFEVVVIPRLDRLGRSNRHLLEVFDLLERAGVQLVSLSESLDTSGPVGRLLRAVLAALAEFESDTIAERVRAVTGARAEAGRFHGGPRPFGYSIGEDGLAVLAREAAVVRRIFAEFNAGRAMRAIALDLNAEGVAHARGGRWTATRIRELLEAPVYVGDVRLKGDVFPGRHPAIIDRETWQRAQTLRAAQRASRGGGRGRRPKRHLFVGGFLRCLNCGSAMYPRSYTSGSDVYRCIGRDQRLTDCDMPQVPRLQVDVAVLGYFASEVLDPEATRREYEEGSHRRLQELRGVLGDAEGMERRSELRRIRLRGVYADGELQTHEWRELDAEAREQGEKAAAAASQLRRQLEVLQTGPESGLFDDWTTLRAAVAAGVNDAQTIEAVRAALARVFEHFLIGPLANPELPGEGVDAGAFQLLPVVRPEVEAFAPKAALALKGRNGEPFRSLFGPILLG